MDELDLRSIEVSSDSKSFRTEFSIFGSRGYRLPRELALRLSLVGLGFLVFFGIGEILCRLFFPDTHLRYVADQHALYYLEPNQVGTISLADGSPSPLAHIDHWGFRYSGVKRREARRILVLGDSLTFGSGVSDRETFSILLDQAYGGDVAVINGGQPGYGVYQMAETLRRVGESIRPRLVVVVLWQGDLLRQPLDAAEQQRFFRKARLLRFVRLSVFLTHIGRRLERFLLRYGADTRVIGDATEPAGSDPNRIVDAYLRGFEADAPRILEMHRQAQQYGQGLLLVLWPKEDFITGAEVGVAEPLTNTIGEFARRHGIPFISLQPVMQRMPPVSLAIPHDGHPTPLAHCLAARYLASEIGRLGFSTLQPIRCSTNEAVP
ncbi:MAG TPA: hypothetical protein VIB79_21725 [Candidatus Binatia bacterium]